MISGTRVDSPDTPVASESATVLSTPALIGLETLATTPLRSSARLADKPVASVSRRLVSTGKVQYEGSAHVATSAYRQPAQRSLLWRISHY